MAWSENTKRFYEAAVARRGGKLISQIGNAQKGLVLLPCGHEKVMSVAGIAGRDALSATKFRCTLCRLDELGVDHTQDEQTPDDMKSKNLR